MKRSFAYVSVPLTPTFIELCVYIFYEAHNWLWLIPNFLFLTLFHSLLFARILYYKLEYGFVPCSMYVRMYNVPTYNNNEYCIGFVRCDVSLNRLPVDTLLCNSPIRAHTFIRFRQVNDTAETHTLKSCIPLGLLLKIQWMNKNIKHRHIYGPKYVITIAIMRAVNNATASSFSLPKWFNSIKSK